MNTKTQQMVKAKILITSIDNMKLFRGKMPTRRWGFCEIVRMVTSIRVPVLWWVVDLERAGQWRMIPP